MEYSTEVADVSLEELISYSKQKESPKVTVVDEVLESEYNYVVEVSKRLRLLFFRIQNSSMLAFIDNSDVVLKLAKELKKKAQVMFYDFAKRPRASIVAYALTGISNDWIVTRDNRLHSKIL